MNKNIMYTPHFAEIEFTESTTAMKHGIVNEPTPVARTNLKRLCFATLEPLRKAIGLPVVITSGYRCKALNDIISHHSKSSQHLLGQAADFYIGWGQRVGGRGYSGDGTPSVQGSNPRQRLVSAFRLIIESEAIDYDQLILYPYFIHVSYISPEANRHYIMMAQGNGKYARVTREDALNIQ